MKNKRFFQKLTAVLLLAALACPIGVHAMAIEEWQSSKTTYRYAGFNYDGWTILYHDHDGKYRSSSWIQEQNFNALPAKYIGVSAEIRNTAGKILSRSNTTVPETAGLGRSQARSRGMGPFFLLVRYIYPTGSNPKYTTCPKARTLIPRPGQPSSRHWRRPA